MGIPDHLTCLLRNLCAGQEATVRTGHGIILLELINKSGKVSGYKINIQNSVAFSYTDNELPKKRNGKTISFSIVSISIECLRISLTMDVKLQYTDEIY